jgi:hypothetical protein
MAMFRRKTDQVYATLQQVQRRISQQTQGGTDALDRDITFSPSGVASNKPAPSATPTPLSTPVNPSPVTAVPGTAPSQADPGDSEIGTANDGDSGSDPAADLSPLINSPMQQMPSKIASAATLPNAWQPSPRRPALALPWEAASVVFLLWLGSLVGVFFIGRHVGQRAREIAEGPGGGQRVEVRVESATNPKAAVQAGSAVLVLASVAKVTADAETRLRGDADRLNRYAEQNANHGYKPWFGVRKPEAGGLQLVFGMVDGKLGIDKTPFASLADVLDRAGYSGARWIDVR